MMFTMFTWHMLRAAAVARHIWWWRYMEGGDPALWPAHAVAIRAVYGY